ncbi:MAG TPA: hypothetical protein VMX58_09025 [Patescibacteria group bacterium]|nr:hypothetical protein [Patescibacteria group bacterium]
MKLKSIPALHPYFLAVCPILFLFSRNIGEVRYGAIVIPVAVVLAASFLILSILKKLIRNSEKAAILTSAGILMFFLYGPLFDRTIAGLTIGGYVIGRNRVFFLLWCILGLLIAWAIIRTRRNLKAITTFLNATSFILIAISLVSIVSFELKAVGHRNHACDWTAVVTRLCEDTDVTGSPPNGPLRDIYYIILDEYARCDVLKQHYGYDNSPFMNYLESRGFYVAYRSCCNHLDTYYSLSSSLNMNYIQSLVPEMTVESMKHKLVTKMIGNNTVVHILKKYNYRHVFFPTIWKVTARNEMADTVCTPLRINLSEFEEILINSSVLRIIGAHRFAQTKRNMTIYTLDELGNIPRMKEPTFTFAHVMIPHPPFLFDADGNRPRSSPLSKRELSRNEYIDAYTDQIAFLNKKLSATIDRILTLSDVQPIIIIQADTGPGFRVPASMDTLVSRGERRFKDYMLMIRVPIFNACYFPDGGDSLLYESESPVNTFRIVFNHYFGAHMELLDDQTYDSVLSGNTIRFDVVATPQ